MAWSKSGGKTFEADFGLSMGEENADRCAYVDTGTRGEGRGSKRTVEEDGRVLMKTRTHTEVVGINIFELPLGVPGALETY